jgi:hypothetical protein
MSTVSLCSFLMPFRDTNATRTSTHRGTEDTEKTNELSVPLCLGVSLSAGEAGQAHADLLNRDVGSWELEAWESIVE